MKLTDVQIRALKALVFNPQGLTAKEVARRVWPDDPGWDRRTAGRGASRHNGALGATMPLRAGRLLNRLGRADLVTNYWYAEGPRAGRWTITRKGRRELEAALDGS